MNSFAKLTDPLHGPCSPTSFRFLPKVCTVEPPGGHVHIVEFDAHGTEDNTKAKQLRISDPTVLAQHLSLETSVPANRIFFISQKNPRLPLDITMELLQSIVSHYGIMSLFLDLVALFAKRVTRTDDGYCSPIRTIQGEHHLELCYVYKYVEIKSSERAPDNCDSWDIRKVGVYHRLNLKTKQSVWIILSPMPASLGEMRIRECIQSELGRERISENPLNLHAVLISCYLTNWHQYCICYEKALGKFSRTVMTTNPESECDISHETLRQTNYFKQGLLPLRSIFASLDLILDTFEKSNVGTKSDDELSRTISNLRNESLAHAENSQYLLQLSDRILIQTSDTLDLKQNDQLFTLARTSASDSRSIRVITILTLIYLPFSFVATLMSMCFFEMDVSNKNIIISSQIWVFFCVSLPLATLTVFFWRWIMSRSFRPSLKILPIAASNYPEKQV